MMPETSLYMAKANELLAQAETMLQVRLFEAAGRTAYLAGFHAAQALIFERDEKIVKTHSGVHSEFAKLTRAEPMMDASLRAFLGRAFNLKTAADYDTGPGPTATAEQVSDAVIGARRFVDVVEVLLR